MPSVRLDKFISERTEYTRSQIKQLAAKGSVTVNGIAVKKSDTKIDPENDSVTVCGQALSENRYRYFLVNKPEGYVCSTDEKDGEIVLNLIPPELRSKGLFPAGRLDKDSTGALLITDDGELAHRMLSPKRHISKIYIVKLDRPFESKYVNEFEKGMVLANGDTCRSAKVKCSPDCETVAFVELTEGKYHQVRRMFSAVGNHVQFLQRISLGSLILPEKLRSGMYMELLHKDVENLFLPLDFDNFFTENASFFSANLINK